MKLHFSVPDVPQETHFPVKVSFQIKKLITLIITYLYSAVPALRSLYNVKVIQNVKN